MGKCGDHLASTAYNRGIKQAISYLFLFAEINLILVKSLLRCNKKYCPEFHNATLLPFYWEYIEIKHYSNYKKTVEITIIRFIFLFLYL